MTTVTKKSDIKEFVVGSGELRVTDPCYTPDTWCAGVLPAVNGTYYAQIGIHVGESECQSVADRISSLKEEIAALNDSDAESTAARWGLESELRQEGRNLKEVQRGRPVYIMAAHESVKDRVLGMFDVGHVMTDHIPGGWTLSSIHVGVDSGQAGLFDAANYASAMEDAGCGDMGPVSDAFYRGITQQTLPSRRDAESDGLAITPFGCASLTFDGDGAYSCYTLLNGDGNTLAAYVLFSAMYEEDEEDAA